MIKSEEYCKCGTFLFYRKRGWLSFARRTKVSTDGKYVKLICPKCGEEIILEI